MPTLVSRDPKQFIRKTGLRKPRPRSAGASSRPMRSENIAELVRFFQTDEGKEEEEEESGFGVLTDNMDILKAGQRRLKTMAQTKPEKALAKEADSSNSSDKRKTQSQNLVALQREGLLPGMESLPDKYRQSRTKQTKEGVERSLQGIEDRPSRTKQDVEAIGRPWLDDALTSIPSTDQGKSTSQIELPLHGLRNESFSFGDLAALVEFSASFPDLYSHDSQPPPYQARDNLEPHSRPEAPSQVPPTVINSVSKTADRGLQRTNEPISREPESLTESRSLGLHTETANTTLNNPVQGYRDPGAIGKPALDKDEASKNDDESESCCKSSCECDDAKSLAVLLRATEKLGLEKKRASQKQQPLGEPSPGSATATRNSPSTGPAYSKQFMTSAVTVQSARSNTTPHSLNQGVTDTPLFVRNPVESRNERGQEGKKIIAQSSTGADHTLSPPQADIRVSNHLSIGPIPLKLVAECMPSVISKTTPPPQLNLSTAKSVSSLNDEGSLFNPSSATSGSSFATLPRPRTLLSPFPIQSRRARSVTPDIGSDGNWKGKKRTKKAPLYALVDAAPLPPPAKPLPSLPPSAGLPALDKPLQTDRKVSTQEPPNSAPLEYRAEDRDSPVLGLNAQNLRPQTSLLESQPSSPSSNRSVDASNASRNSSDGHSSRRASSAASRPESRRGRADQVHAIRMRDIDSKKREENSVIGSTDKLQALIQSMGQESSQPTQSGSQKPYIQVKPKTSRVDTTNELFVKSASANAQSTIDGSRRGSTSSLPGSNSITYGYEGGLSRSVSVTSGSIDSLSVRNPRAVYPSRHASENHIQKRLQPDSPLPSSDDERVNLRTRRLKVNGQRRDTDQFENSHSNNPVDGKKKKKQYNKQKEASIHGQLASPYEFPQRASLPGDSPTNNIHLLRHLEARIVTLERQNKMLQAALLAALDMGVSHDAESMHSRSTSPTTSSMRVPKISERPIPSPTSIDSSRKRQGKTIAQKQSAPRNIYVHDRIA